MEVVSRKEKVDRVRWFPRKFGFSSCRISVSPSANEDGPCYHRWIWGNDPPSATEVLNRHMTAMPDLSRASTAYTSGHAAAR